MVSLRKVKHLWAVELIHNDYGPESAMVVYGVYTDRTKAMLLADKLSSPAAVFQVVKLPLNTPLITE